MLTVSKVLTVGIVSVACILILGLYRLAANGKPLHREFAKHASTVEGHILDVIGNLSLVRAFGGIQQEHRRFGDTLEYETAARKKSLLFLEKLRLLHAVIMIALAAIMLAWGIHLWEYGRATTGDVVLIATLGFSILNATRDLAVALVDTTQHFARLSEALSTLLLPHELKDSPQAPVLIQKEGKVDIENIGFTYPNGLRVFDGFSLHIEPGQHVGVIGESGGGKSTLFALLQRSYDANEGRILIDGQDIAGVTQSSLRDSISVVPQEVLLLNRSLAENICYGRPDISHETMLHAARAARCLDFIEKMPQGFDTIVGDRGVKLSGGQRQRIAIARAIIKDAPILLLDEATSALDSESEAEIQKALDYLIQGRTVIAIAHRLSTLRSFDRIVVLSKGRLIDDRPPCELFIKPGTFKSRMEYEIGRTKEAA